MKKYRSQIIILLVLGAVLRVINIDSADFWRDEAFTLRAAVMNFGDMWSALTNDTAPPLYTIILHYWLKIFPLTEFWARVPSLLFGVGTIYATYLLAKELFPYSRKYIYLSTLFVALNPVLIFYSQEARAYSLLSLLATISLYLIVKVSGSEKVKRSDWLLLSITTIAGLYTQNLFIFIAFVNGLIIFFHKLNIKDFRQSIKHIAPLFLSYLAAGIVFLPWFFIFLEQSSTVSEGGFWLTLDPLHDPYNTLKDAFTGEQTWVDSEMVRTVLVYLSNVLAGMFILGSLVTIYKHRKNDKFNQKLLLVLAWTLVNFLIVYAYGFKTSFVYIRYLIYLIVPVLVITLIPILNIRIPKTMKYLLIIFVIGVLAVYSFITLGSIPDSKAHMEELVTQVETVNDQDTLILHPHAYTFHGFDVYSDLDSYVYSPTDDLPYFEGLAALTEKDYYRNVEIRDYNQVLVIYLWGEDERLTVELEKNYKKTDNYDYAGNLHLDIWTLK
ncbi:hypothetical protein GF389_02475 [Candidatus Dojkabacteria bacterium]|nr:hypothetical protein [Candidatus Dojkabacteria bacterium]